ncbi:L,D-transpeptidase family protein [Nonomuraea sp. NPDC050328]|uniref:L,D-transpeptidase family protein n=1 Tax=Nonomuraea sp. NPDC050328 TaxID=3364361 RepID=UPI0037B00501
MLDQQILEVEERLAKLRFDPGVVDGVFTEETATALWALQKLNGLKPVSRVTPATERALKRPRKIRRPVRDGVVVDLGDQLLFHYERGKLRLIAHVSTGANRHYCLKGHCGYAVTPVGEFQVQRRVHGWEDGPLGAMYKPVYFNGGIALHGSVEVPKRAASHGCVRMPLHIADRLFPRLPVGTTVLVRR